MNMKHTSAPKTELATIPRHADDVPAIPVTAAEVLKTFLARRTPRTLEAYDWDLKDFGKFLEAGSAHQALGRLFKMDPGRANQTAADYVAHLVGRGLSPATIARRIAALRSIVKAAKISRVVAWGLVVECPKVEKNPEDTAGPGEEGWRDMLDCARLAAESGRAKPVRDLAIIRLLHDLGLRRGELVGLDLADVKLTPRRASVAVLGKGRTKKQRLTLPELTRAAVSRWLDVRPGGREPKAPLFVRLDRAASGPDRLTAMAVFRVVRNLGEAAGLDRPTAPHGLRHEAITRALKQTNGNIRTVQRFSRHKDARTVLIYDDNRQDLGGEVAELVAADYKLDPKQTRE
jgi:integrase/recombinase XerC